MPDTDVGQGDAGSNLPAGAQTPSPNTNGDHHPSVEGHDHVFNIENGN